MVPFAVSKLSIWCSPTCLSFIVLSLESDPFGSEFSSLPRTMPRSLPPMFASRTFTTSGLTFKSLIYLELIFEYGGNSGPVIFLCMYLCSSPQHHSSTRLPFHRRVFLAPLSWVNWPCMRWLSFLLSDTSWPLRNTWSAVKNTGNICYETLISFVTQHKSHFYTPASSDGKLANNKFFSI